MQVYSQQDTVGVIVGVIVRVNFIVANKFIVGVIAEVNLIVAVIVAIKFKVTVIVTIVLACMCCMAFLQGFSLKGIDPPTDKPEDDVCQNMEYVTFLNWSSPHLAFCQGLAFDLCVSPLMVKK